VQLGPNQVVDVPITITQTAPEPVGSHHTIRVMASSHVTLQNAQHPNDVHDESKPLGGVQFQVAVLRHPKLTCRASGGTVTGTLTGLDPLDTGTMVYVVTANRSRDHDGHDGKDHDEYRRDDDDADREGDDYKRTVSFGTGVLVPVTGGSFTVQVPGSGRGVCLYAGSVYSAPPVAACSVCSVGSGGTGPANGPFRLRPFCALRLNSVRRFSLDKRSFGWRLR
jgi:hypothetical protein